MGRVCEVIGVRDGCEGSARKRAGLGGDECLAGWWDGVEQFKVSMKESGTYFKTSATRPHSSGDFCTFIRLIALYTSPFSHAFSVNYQDHQQRVPKHVGKFVWFRLLRNCSVRCCLYSG